MARKRYVIWDEKSDVYTPSGEVFSAEQWLARYPIAKLASEYLVISGATYNGGFCMVYSDMVDIYEKMGCDFSECGTDMQAHLDAIEAFEELMNTPVEDDTVSDETRIADALEDMVVLQEVAAMSAE
jgi:hypothetical protein